MPRRLLELVMRFTGVSDCTTSDGAPKSLTMYIPERSAGRWGMRLLYVCWRELLNERFQRRDLSCVCEVSNVCWGHETRNNFLEW